MAVEALRFLNLSSQRVPKFLHLLLFLVIISFFVHLQEARVTKFLNDWQSKGPVLLHPRLLSTPLDCMSTLNHTDKVKYFKNQLKKNDRSQMFNHTSR